MHNNINVLKVIVTSTVHEVFKNVSDANFQSTFGQVGDSCRGFFDGLASSASDSVPEQIQNADERMHSDFVYSYCG